MDEALGILARVGTDNAPTLSELAAARDTIARELHRLRSEGSADLDALMTLRETYQTAVQAVTEAEEAQAAAAAQVDEVLDGIPNPDETADEATDETGAEGAVAASAGRVLSVAEAVERLGLRAPSTFVTDPEPSLADVTTSVILGDERRDTATWHDVAHAFADNTSRSAKKGRERLLRIENKLAEERMLPGRIADNTRIADSFLAPTAVSAAGGCCSLPTPIYENPVFSSTSRPIRDALPTMGVQQRGKVQFFPAICLPDQGAAIWTCEDDAAVDPADESTWKQCLPLDCDEPVEVDVDAIYSCLTVGNFQARYAPEQWQGFLQAVAAYQARIAEVALFDKMRAGVTTTHTLDATGSLYVTLLNGVSLAAATIRQDQRYTDLQLTLVLPEWVRNAIRSDLRSRRLDCPDTIETTDAMIASALAAEGVGTVVWSPDIDPIEPDGQTDGPLTDYPDTASAVLYPEGSFSFLDGGTLDLGTEIRDHSLNRQNNLAAFAESFEGLLARACNAKGLDIPVEVCNDAPCPAGS